MTAYTKRMLWKCCLLIMLAVGLFRPGCPEYAEAKAIVSTNHATYTYKEDTTIDGKKLNVIVVEYDFTYEATDELLNAGQTLTQSVGW